MFDLLLQPGINGLKEIQKWQLFLEKYILKSNILEKYLQQSLFLVQLQAGS